eukprot:CAMPEP_0194262248 /NCGR_PEP_ID=MMETSP0158-20130606/46449_1 /TAXON_ID=33649 /ORGANISM="Thalassionema nitzschioides, Strain L26-B" /LENGTH=401 /DNA_ID=CAMNT_0039002401 /DNA_START=149 /DNA_END=1354 /DNA_ORIENTATION=+
MIIVSCCDSENSILLEATTRHLSSNILEIKDVLVEQKPSSSLEMVLFQLFDSIGPAHWNDSDTGEQHCNMKTVTNFKQRAVYVDKEDITLVTHGSIEKFSLLVDQISQWKGPVSFVIYLDSREAIKEFCSKLQHVTQDSESDFNQYVSIHALLEKHGGSLPYPNNMLRNIAQKNIESNYFLLMDVDFMPCPSGTYEHFKSHLKDDFFWTKLRNNTIFVLPAFERFAESNESTVTLDMVPQNKDQLIDLLDQKLASTFHPYFPPGHYPTDYQKWLQNEPSEFSYPIQYMKRFEPYILAYKHGLPEFWDGFRGFGYNAATWFWELDLAGYKYEVVRDYFVLHLNHEGRKERIISDGSIAKLQLRRFMRYISRKYQVERAKLRYWKGRRYGNGTQVSLFCESCL